MRGEFRKMCDTEFYDPVPLILEQFLWAVSNIKRFRGTPDEKRFREIGKHFERELLKYLSK